MNSSIIKNERVRLEQDADEPASALPGRAASAATSKSNARCQKSVQLLRENDVVHAIEVRCSCGEVTVVELEYDPK